MLTNYGQPLTSLSVGPRPVRRSMPEPSWWAAFVYYFLGAVTGWLLSTIFFLWRV